MSHRALLYGSADELVEGARDFLDRGAAAGDPMLVALPAASRALLAPVIPPSAEVCAMEDLGRNPARIIPSVRAWAAGHPARRVRVLGEGVWPGRSLDELAEQAVHESLVDRALADLEVEALCPYDLRRVPDALVRDVERTHRELCCGGTVRRSTRHGEPLELIAQAAGAAPAEALVVWVDDGLRPLRRHVRELAMRAGLGRDRADEALVAINEAATNALVHGGAGGVVRLWTEGRALLCEVVGGGVLTDPLAGRRAPHDDSESGRGLWLIHHLCDLAQVRETDAGTLVRMRVSRS